MIQYCIETEINSGSHENLVPILVYVVGMERIAYTIQTPKATETFLGKFPSEKERNQVYKILKTYRNDIKAVRTYHTEMEGESSVTFPDGFVWLGKSMVDSEAFREACKERNLEYIYFPDGFDGSKAVCLLDGRYQVMSHNIKIFGGSVMGKVKVWDLGKLFGV